MATISSSADTDFTVSAAGDFRFTVKSGRARLFKKNDDASYSIVGDCPSNRLASGVAIVSNTEASTVYKWQSIDGTTATVEVEQ